MDPELWELLEEGDSEDEIAAIVRLGQPNVVPKGVRVVAEFNDIATIRMERGRIQEVRAQEGVASLKAAEPPGFRLAPDLEFDRIEPAEGLSEAGPWIYERRPPSLSETGRDVVCGFVDWGFDFVHADFRHEDGRTRILALWDQRPPPSPRSPQPYGYGIVHTADDINRALAAEDPYAALGYHPGDNAHGTHVASIAAGNGRGCGLTGVAPGADLVCVHLSTWDRTELARFGDSVTLLEAVHRIVRTADERPWVINLSMGRHGEHHKGRTPVEQGLDAALRSAPGGCIVLSCGNYFQRRIHASGQLRPAEKRTLVWEIEDADITPNKLEVWYEGSRGDVFDVEIRSPDGSISARAALGERAPLTADGRDIGTVFHQASEPNTLDHYIEIILYRGGPTGPWELTLIAKDVVDGRFHCWIERDSECSPCQSRFRPEDAVPSYTTGTICNGLRTIAVGAYNPHSAERELAPFSSCGPTRDDRVKPDLIAPGESILAARSAPRDPHAEVPPWTLMSGTSMAAPHVAGTIALMFEAAKRPLRSEETRNLLLANTERVTGPEEVLDRVGSGYLDIARAVEAARRIGSAAPELQPSLHRKTEEDTVNRDNDISSTGTWDQESPPENGESNPLGDPDTVSFEAYEPAEPGTRDADEQWGSETDDRPFEREEDEEPALYENVEATEQDLYETDVVSEQTSTSSLASEMDVFWLVELADQMIAERAVARAPTQVLHDVLSRAGMAESLILPGNGRLLSAAELFDAFAYPGREALRDQLEQNFELVAPPRAPLDGRLRANDLLIRRGEAGLGHLSVIASPELRGFEELLSEGLIPEAKGPGKYAQVVETGARPHTLSDAFARRVVDAAGRLPCHQLVLRPCEHVRQHVMESIRLEETVHATFSVGSLVPARRFVEMPLTYEDFITNATGSGIVIRRTRCDTLGHVASLNRRLRIGMTSAGHEVAISHADLISSMSSVPMLWTVGSGDRLQAALDLMIFHPADPADLTRLPPGSTRFPLAVICMGNHGVCSTTLSGALDPPIAPLGGGPPIRFGHSATFGPEIQSHHGYSAITRGRPPGVTTGPASVPYLQEELARHGIISVSVSTNAANYFDSLLETRADLILKAVAEMRRLNSDRGSRFFHRIDEKVAFVGHSRGGDAAVRAALKQRSLNVRALVQIAPTDIAGLTAGLAPTGGARIDFVTSPMRVSSDLTAFHLVVYGSRDGDVSGLQNVRVSEFGDPFRHYDRSSAQRAFFFWHGATHNRFNRFWEDTEEEPLVDLAHPAGLLDRIDQEARTRELVGGCLRFVLNREMGERDRLNGRVLSTIAPTRPMAAMWKVGRTLKTIDRFDDPHSDRNTLGGRNRPPTSGLIDEIRLANENPAGAGVTAFQFMHIDRVLRAAFTSTPVPGVVPAPGGAPLPPTTPTTATSSGRWRAEIPLSDRNFSSFTLLTLRVTKKWDPAAIMAANRPVVKVRMVDTGGHAHEELAVGRISTLPAGRRVTLSSPPPGWPATVELTKFHFETWEVALSSFASASVNLHRVAAVELEMIGLAGQPIYADTLSLVRL